MPLNAAPDPVDEPVSAPIVDDAASFEVVMLILLVAESNVACRLLAASLALRSFSVETWPVRR
jgi:hypothetical protein